MFFCGPGGLLESSLVPGVPVLELGFKNLLAYLLGSVIGSLLVGRLRGGVDIRTQGSGNALLPRPVLSEISLKSYT